ncbi:MAG: hypothetical protein MJZ81_07480 [Bacteroidales bacterium]|nr:hypothetical protein [Bacteroidales bacterium]
MLTANEYQAKAHQFAKYGGNVSYPFCGLAEEAGEALGKFAKFIRKHEGMDPVTAAGWETMQDDVAEFKIDLKKELGDVLWMVAEIATTFDLELEQIMAGNLLKLDDRARRNVIIGEGDNR